MLKSEVRNILLYQLVYSFSVSVSLLLPAVLYATVVLVTVYDNAVLDSMISMSVHTHTVERTYTYRNGDVHVYYCYNAYIGNAYIVYAYICQDYTVC